MITIEEFEQGLKELSDPNSGLMTRTRMVWGFEKDINKAILDHREKGVSAFRMAIALEQAAKLMKKAHLSEQAAQQGVATDATPQPLSAER